MKPIYQSFLAAALAVCAISHAPPADADLVKTCNMCSPSTLQEADTNFRANLTNIFNNIKAIENPADYANQIVTAVRTLEDFAENRLYKITDTSVESCKLAEKILKNAVEMLSTYYNDFPLLRHYLSPYSNPDHFKMIDDCVTFINSDILFAPTTIDNGTPNWRESSPNFNKIFERHINDAIDFSVFNVSSVNDTSEERVIATLDRIELSPPELTITKFNMFYMLDHTQMFLNNLNFRSLPTSYVAVKINNTPTTIVATTNPENRNNTTVLIQFSYDDKTFTQVCKPPQNGIFSLDFKSCHDVDGPRRFGTLSPWVANFHAWQLPEQLFRLNLKKSTCPAIFPECSMTNDELLKKKTSQKELAIIFVGRLKAFLEHKLGLKPGLTLEHAANDMYFTQPQPMTLHLL